MRNVVFGFRLGRNDGKREESGEKAALGTAGSLGNSNRCESCFTQILVADVQARELRAMRAEADVVESETDLRRAKVGSLCFEGEQCTTACPTEGSRAAGNHRANGERDRVAADLSQLQMGNEQLKQRLRAEIRGTQEAARAVLEFERARCLESRARMDGLTAERHALAERLKEQPADNALLGGRRKGSVVFASTRPGEGCIWYSCAPSGASTADSSCLAGGAGSAASN